MLAICEPQCFRILARMYGVLALCDRLGLSRHVASSPRCGARYPSIYVGEMTRTGEPECHRDVADRLAPVGDHRACALDPLTRHELMGRHSRRLPEAPGKVERAHVHKSRKALDCQPVGKVGPDEIRHMLDLFR